MPARTKLLACLRAHGALPPVPHAAHAPGKKPAVPSPVKLRAALHACGIDLNRQPVVTPARRRALLTAFVACLNRQGLKLPAPNLSGRAPLFPIREEMSPKFHLAALRCEHLLSPAAAAGTATTG